MARHLLVAHQTVDSAELLRAVRVLADSDGSAEFTILVPATPVRHLLIWEEGETKYAAQSRARGAMVRLSETGCNVTSARVGDANPVLAVEDELRRQAYRTIVISTFPERTSRWLRLGTVARLRQMFPNHTVIHVVAESVQADLPADASRGIADRPA
jgi:hypothetical protein